ncbi:MAG: aminotransferase class I/II-fold pyridoxal phosphate-dependent enzyme [Sedimentisphaerales bacterium]|nr:aminotransferase class I/II-fold pyridoxal phosphate-dependent enzyme [Sedimentisphaerales bacterium]
MSEIIEKYQRRFAEFFGAERAFAFWKGRVALYAILKAMGIGPGDEIILPGYTCVMNVNPIKYLGAKPVYVDIEPVTFNIDVNLLREKISPRTKVIIAQHTYGYPCDMDAVMEIAGEKGIVVVEDCCLALGSKYKGRMVGTFGKAAYFSSQWNKPYTTGLGGMVITSDSELAGKIQSLCESWMRRPSSGEIFMLWAQLAVYRLFIYPRTTAFAQNVFRYLTKKGAVVGSSGTNEFRPVMAEDFFKSISGVQARSGLRQLEKLSDNIKHRKEMALLYEKLLKQRGWSIPKFDSSGSDPVLVRYPLRIDGKSEALEKAAGKGIELGSWFECPLHPIETPLEVYNYMHGSCPQAEIAARQVVNLPLHPRVDEKIARKTVEFVTGFKQA